MRLLITSTHMKMLREWFGESINQQALLAVVFTLSGIIAGAWIWAGQWPTTFWVTSTLAVVSFAISRHKGTLVAASVGFVALRATAAAVLTLDAAALIVAIVGWSIVGFLLLGARHLERRKTTGLVAGKSCPACGRTVDRQHCVLADDETSKKLIGLVDRCPCGEWTLYEIAGTTRRVEHSE